MVGFFLAGIYPVGLKIASDYFKTGLGTAFGWLVAALVMGTALPHLITGVLQSLNWHYVFYCTSAMSITGGLLVYLLVEDGPYLVRTKKIKLRNALKVFGNQNFRLASFGYFGHMWELYTLWAFIPLITINILGQSSLNNYTNFSIIAIGSITSMASGYIARYISTKKTALLFIIISCCCCLTSFYALNIGNKFIGLIFLYIWGATVIGDSPMFSTLVAESAPAENKGTALTIVNCIGFSLTILSLIVFEKLLEFFDVTSILSVLAVGPILSIISLIKTQFKRNVSI